jgi:hypothetical protein
MSKYEELVELLEEVGVLQLEDEWAVQIQKLIAAHKKKTLQEPQS